MRAWRKPENNWFPVIASELAFQERPFVVSVKERMPQWELIGLDEIQNLLALCASAAPGNGSLLTLCKDRC